MNKKNTISAIYSCFMIIVISLIFCARESTNKTKGVIDLWPEIEPFQKDYLKVSDIHKIYYELCGNLKGKPVFVIHGGPGAGCSPYMRRFFNPDKFLIVLHDQRGCGKSKPNAELRENTTQALVEDIENLRKKLNLDKIILFGGSWGSTLSLAYGETYPDNVSGMVLRGIWLASKEELNSYWDRIAMFFPKEYESLKKVLPDSLLPLRTKKLSEYLQSNNKNDIENNVLLIARYACNAYGLHIRDEFLDEFFTMKNIKEIYTNALLESHYGANNCFLEENQLLRDAHRIKNIPTIIVNGRYDITCPPFIAHRLYKHLPQSRLFIAEEAGHVISEKPIEEELLKVMCEFE